MKILKITHGKMTLYLFQWVGFFQIKNVEDIERCFLRLWDKNKNRPVAYWNYDMHWKEHCDGVRTRPIKFSFIQQKLLFQWRKFLHDLLLVVFTGKEVHIVSEFPRNLYTTWNDIPQIDLKKRLPLWLWIKYCSYSTLRMLSISLSFIHLW